MGIMRHILLYSVVLLYASPLFAFSTEVIHADSPRGLKIPVLVLAPESPKAALVMFTGGTGVLDVEKTLRTAQPNSLLVRIAGRLADKGLLVALMDKPPNKSKIPPKFRISKKHAKDVRGVINALRRKGDMPVWMVGTSSGTWSAASATIKLKSHVSGLILMSSVTRSRGKSWMAKRFPDGINSMNLHRVRVPALIIAHKYDACWLTPPGDVPTLKETLRNAPRVQALMLSGGRQDVSTVCNAGSSHGLFGLENEVVDSIVAFIGR